MDDDAGEEETQNPPFTRCWTATSSYDVYMVDAPKENRGDDKEDPSEDKPYEIQSKHRRQRRRSKSHRSKDSNTGTGEDNTPEGAEDNKDPLKQLMDNMIGKMGRLAPASRLRTKNQTTEVIFRSPRMR